MKEDHEIYFEGHADEFEDSAYDKDEETILRTKINNQYQVDLVWNILMFVVSLPKKHCRHTKRGSA